MRLEESFRTGLRQAVCHTSLSFTSFVIRCSNYLI